MMRILTALLAAAALAMATPALAAPEAAEHGEPHESHGHKAPHGGDPAEHAEHADEHGGEHGGHHYFTADDDGDGVPNWRDSMNGDEPNEDTYVVADVAFHAFNLIVFLAIVGWFVRRPIADTFRERALGIKKDLTESARLRDEAHQRHQEIVSRLDKIESEITAMEAEAEEEAAHEEAKLVERAEREAERIAEQAQRNIRDEATRARMALRREAVELAVQLAEGALRDNVSSSDQQVLARQFLESLDDEKGAA